MLLLFFFVFNFVVEQIIIPNPNLDFSLTLRHFHL